MRVAYLGSGTWGFTLACLLSENGHDVTVWSATVREVDVLSKKREHPKLEGFKASNELKFTNSMPEALKDADCIVESVTSSGIRPVFEKLKALGAPKIPIILTSKGIEQKSGFLLTEIILDVLGEEYKNYVACISGPSHAEEVIRKLPTSVVCSGFTKDAMQFVKELFSNSYFRVYPNSDINGVEFGAAMKNIIAIACGISDGLGFGDNTKAALMTRGLHEIRKLSVCKGCLPETLNGLSGMGDLCVTCLSTFSRNYRFGRLLAEGKSPEQAKEIIGMVVEGTYSAVSALELGKKHRIELPITETINKILFENLKPSRAVELLLQRAVKEEHL